ncbi:MAG: PqqD family protein [bacterium]
MKVTPVARTASLIVKEVDGETLVYDLKTDEAHCLNETAARVWKNCDGRKSVSDISEVLSAESNTSVKDEVVWLALDQLEKFKLLKDAPARPAVLAGMTRRQMVARLGLAAIAIPSIISLVAPTASAQGSGLCCTGAPDCPTGFHCCQNDPCVIPNNQSTKQCFPDSVPCNTI